MTALKLGDQLKGAWDHAVFVTYNVGLVYFEWAVRPLLGPSCRNVIVLADGRLYLDACDSAARSGLVRHVNQRYVAAGIFAPHAAHAKLILLTSENRGRLLVGSGNLSLRGYGQSGELFSQYDYSSDEPEALPAFAAVREFLETLRARGHLSHTVDRNLDHLLEGCPWLFQGAAGQGPVVHNLQDSFLEQLQAAVGQAPVEELLMMAPFFDPGAVAAGRLLEVFRPAAATIYVQPGATSVDPAALGRLLARWPQLRVRPFQFKTDRTYVHAKLLLLKLADRAICLQGSPNLSQVALLLASPHGNVELANLLLGERDAFDSVFEELRFEPATRAVSGLDLAYKPPEETDVTAGQAWYLTAGEWNGSHLRLYFSGVRPDLTEGLLSIDDQPFALEVVETSDSWLALRLTGEVSQLLERPAAVQVLWHADGARHSTNAIFVCHRPALDAMLQSQPAGTGTTGLSEVDLADEDLESTLMLLDATLVVDGVSVSQLIGQSRRSGTQPPPDPAEGEATPLSYDQLDYDVLRRHPKVRGYYRHLSGAAGIGAGPTRLQLILSAILEHFANLRGGQAYVPGAASAIPIEQLDDATGDVDDPAPENEAEKVVHRQSLERRLRRAIRSFIKRYLDGLHDPRFVQAVGWPVMVDNLGVLTHVLLRLFARPWLQPEFVVDALLRSWEYFWRPGGYWDQLDTETRAQASPRLEAGLAGAHAVAALYYSTRVLQTSATTPAAEQAERKLRLRDVWRQLLVQRPFPITGKSLEDAWHAVSRLVPYDPPRPSAMLDELSGLARYETRENLLRTLAVTAGLAPGCCSFELVRVQRPGVSGTYKAECLVVTDANALLEVDSALEMLAHWMGLEVRDYYRIAYPDPNRAERFTFYDVTYRDGVYMRRDGAKDMRSFTRVLVTVAPWQAELDRLRHLADQVPAGLPLPEATSSPSQSPAGGVLSGKPERA